MDYEQTVNDQTAYLSGGEHTIGALVSGSNCMISPPPGCYQPGYPNVSKNYVGVKFYINGEIHYGWIELIIRSGGQSIVPENWGGISKIVYDDEANKSVTVGTITTPTTQQTTELFVLYPNPVKDQLFIRSDLDIDAIQVYNATGQAVYTVNVYNGGISMHTWPKGIYSLTIKSRERMERKLIVKE